MAMSHPIGQSGQLGRFLYHIESGIFRVLTLTCATAANASLEVVSIDITRVPNSANNLGDAASNFLSFEIKVFIAYRIVVATIIESC
jgi:hypothetical protein